MAKKINKNYGFVGSKTFNLGDFRNLQKEIHKANQRITRVESRYGEGAWAIRELYGKLDTSVAKAITPFGQIRITKDMSQAQLNLVRRTVKEFLKSKTSTLTGIRQTRNNIMSGLKQSLSATEDIKLTDKEIEALFKLVEDKDTRSTVEKIGASTMWKLLIDAREKKANKTDFLVKVKQYYNYSNDQDVKSDLSDFYKKYIKNL